MTTHEVRELTPEDSARIVCQPPYGETCDQQARWCTTVRTTWSRSISFWYACDQHVWTL